MRRILGIAVAGLLALSAAVCGAQSCNEPSAVPAIVPITQEVSPMDQSFMRCKFMVHSVSEIAGDQPGVSVRMGAVYEPYEARAHTENAIFGKFTPFGEFSASIFNPTVAERLQSLVGKSVYLDFTEAPSRAVVG